MKNLFKAMSLSLVLASPLTFGQIAMAQELIQPDTKAEYRLLLSEVSQPTPAGLVAEATEQQVWSAYSSSGYTYTDAVVLAKFWGQTVDRAKTGIGHKMLGGWESKINLELIMTDARTKALATAEDLTVFSKTGYSYSDALAMAEFWGDKSPFEAKLRIERNLILGNESVVNEVRRFIRSQENR